jgi:DNA-binding NarL/FixJ family response regulator
MVLSLLEQDFEVVGTANNGIDLVSEAQRLQPDAIVLDITMPILNGIEAAHEIHEARLAAKLIFLTVHERSSFVRACFEEGGSAYVTKSRLKMDLVPAIRSSFGQPLRLALSPSPIRIEESLTGSKTSSRGSRFWSFCAVTNSSENINESVRVLKREISL